MRNRGVFYDIIGRLRRKIAVGFYNNSKILDECTLINIRRIFNLGLIVIPLRIINIILFKSDNNSSSKLWQNGIIASHFAILIFWIGLLVIVYPLISKKEVNTKMRVIQYLAPISIMLSGIVIVTIDQLITTNITPFILVSLLVGIYFFIRPKISLIIYIFSYIAYYIAIAFTITDKQVLLSNRANGVTIIGIAFMMSLIIWRFNYINISQKYRIEEQQKQLEQMAYYDQLTNLHNRHFFNKIIKKESSLIERYGNESTIIVLDVDDFKKVNDSYGHLAGDQLLVQLAQLISDNTRESDTVARYGGEEFIILAPNTNIDEGILMANKLNDIIAKTPFTIDQTQISITASFGVAPLELDDDKNFESFYSKADEALGMAKIRGKNRVERI